MPTLTETAASEIKKIMKDQGLPEQTRLRVGVKGGGCSGFSYMLDLTEEPPTESDEELECHGVK
ncbi:MAG: iron-sulfur cluster assembly accessory protein, partial [Gemmatimonadaceae bacterium]|nr:iron-sulfur cluster assembly accessory protein [Gemmatimonadaceae bacterium]